MATNLGLDDKLVAEVHRISGCKTKKEAVTDALREYLLRRRQVSTLRLFGTIDMDPEYDYKRERRRKRA